MNKEKIIKAGEINSEVKKYAKSIIQKGMPLLEIANNIENKIIELGGKIAFPTSLGIDEIAAHYTPSYNEDTLARGLLKVDIGVHIDGWISDSAFSIDLEDDEENKKLIESSEKALENAISVAKEGIPMNEIGKVIQNTIEDYGFTPIVNLNGHQIKRYNLHAGLTIPNTEKGNRSQLLKGLYAIEPFSTNGSGKVHDGKNSGIYLLIENKKPRNSISRKILAYIQEEYNNLPFCSRWIYNQFGSKGLLALRELENIGNLHHFPQLVENSGSKVSQAEHTILIEDKTIITT